jgi:SAM-dependent methyltransferase
MSRMDADSPVTLCVDVEHASVFDVYDELLVPLCFQRYAEDLAERVADVRSGSLLEVACGTGAATRVLARALPASVAITATDIVPGMVERAQRGGTAREVTWDVADAAALPYDDESFDVVVCQFGAMFFPAKVDAFAEAARVLRPGGRIELAVWDRIEMNEFGSAVAEAMTALFPDDPPRFLERMPFSYHDPDMIVADLVAGGLVAPATVEKGRAPNPRRGARGGGGRVLRRDAGARPAAGGGDRPASWRDRRHRGPLGRALRRHRPRGWERRPRRERREGVSRSIGTRRDTGTDDSWVVAWQPALKCSTSRR